MGADVIPNALDVAAYDVAMVVKRAPADLIKRIHKAGTRLVWDIVDAWPQPVGNDWTRAECMAWLEQQLAAVRPHAVIAATEVMAKDVQSLGYPAKCIRHHARPGLQRAKIADCVNTVAYEGSAQYIRWWSGVIKRQCDQRGWRFVVNPERLTDADIVVCLRDQTGYAPRAWKSGVKLSNAQAAGLPVVCARETGYLEQQAGHEAWADDAQQLEQAFDVLTAEAMRSAAKQAHGPSLQDVSADCLQWLKSC